MKPRRSLYARPEIRPRRAMHHGCVALANDGEEGSGEVVTDIAKLSVGREEYYTRELATDHEQYLSGHGESPGRWYGADATALGLQAKHPWPGSRPCSRAATAGRRWRGSAGGGGTGVGQPGGPPGREPCPGGWPPS